MKKFLTLSIAAFSFMLLLTACGSDSNDDASANSAPTPDEVNMQFAWVHTMEYSGFYLAQEEGRYADENLKVNLMEGGFDEDGNFIPPIERVTSGEAGFGVISGDQLLQARADGAPVVGLAAIYQQNPVVLMSLAENNIRRPQDLVGKTLSIDTQATTGLSVTALLRAQDIDTEEINIIRRTDFTNAPLVNGEVDLLDGFITNQPVLLEQEGYDLNLILASDYGIDVYANVIFTTEEMVAEQPDVVERFLRATLQGYQDAVDNPQRAAELSVEYNDTLSLDAETESMLTSVPLINPADSKIGLMTADVWQQTHQTLLDQDIISEPINVSEVYTTDFLDEIYAE